MIVVTIDSRLDISRNVAAVRSSSRGAAGSASTDRYFRTRVLVQILRPNLHKEGIILRCINRELS